MLYLVTHFNIRLEQVISYWFLMLCLKLQKLMTLCCCLTVLDKMSLILPGGVKSIFDK